MLDDTKQIQTNSLIPESYSQFKQDYDRTKLLTAQKKGKEEEKNMLRNYIPEINKDKEVLK